MSKPVMRFAPMKSCPVPKEAYLKEGVSFDRVGMKGSVKVDRQVCTREATCICSGCENGREMNRAALRLLANGRAIASAEPVNIRVLPDGSRWVEASQGDLKLGREKHAAALDMAILRRAERIELGPDAQAWANRLPDRLHVPVCKILVRRKREAELASVETRVLKQGVRVDRKEVKITNVNRATGVDTSSLGSNKMFGTQGRWD